MYPLVLLALPAAAHDRRAARYFLPLPVAGLGISLYHLLVERGVISETQSCQVSAPGGCGVKWIEEFGYMTIPTLAATGFALSLVLLALAATDRD
jgi:disulfide bond formation protein DsbB